MLQIIMDTGCGRFRSVLAAEHVYKIQVGNFRFYVMNSVM
jgi:hypothetical protein